MSTRWTTPIIAVMTLLCWQTPAIAAMPGDPTNDGNIQTNDIICVARAVVGFDNSDTPCGNAPVAADVDCNGRTVVGTAAAHIGAPCPAWLPAEPMLPC